MLSAIAFIALLFVLYQFWQVQQQARDIAWKAVKKFSLEQGIQVLDDSLVADAIRPVKSSTGWRLWRQWRFEFSTSGARRYRGQISMLGRRVERIEVDAYQALDD